MIPLGRFPYLNDDGSLFGGVLEYLVFLLRVKVLRQQVEDLLVVQLQKRYLRTYSIVDQKPGWG